jgi:endonuclease/exonuclease/phosphatase (EEP) superfamily protein YafD
MPIVPRLLRTTLCLAIAAFVVVTGLSYQGELHWSADLLSHFRVQMSGVAFLLGCVAGVLRMPRTSLAAFGVCAAHLVPVLSGILPLAETPSSSAKPLRVAMANVLTSNREHESLLEFVRAEDPDVLGLLEVNLRWLAALDPLREAYPYGVRHPQANNFGIALLSRVPLEDVELRPLGHAELMAVVAKLRLEDRAVSLALAHPVPPVGGFAARLRNQQFERLSELRTEFAAEEFILLSDLNSSPWSPFYARLERRSGLTNASRGHGYFPTWPTHLPLLMLPLDHCLLSSGLRASAFRLGPHIGSDHLPLVVDIALR